MTIPTENEFKESIQFLKSTQIENIKANPHSILSSEELKKIVNRLSCAINKKNTTMGEYTAIEWFNSQPNIIASFKNNKFKPLYYKNTNKIQMSYIEESIWETQELTTVDSISEWKDSLFKKEFEDDNEMQAYLKRANSKIYKNKAFWRKLNNWINWARPEWEISIYTSLMNYFYSNRYLQVCNESKEKESQLAEAKILINKLCELEDSIIEPVRVSGYVNSIKKQIEKQLYANVETIYPINRNDKTARERLLIYDLYKNNMKFTDSSKTAFIYNVICIEGIKYPIDKRTIERQIAKWKKSQIEYRQKCKDYIHITAGQL